VYTAGNGSDRSRFCASAIIVFGMIGRFGDLPRLLGAMNPEEK
jgi:hypothetical protein